VVWVNLDFVPHTIMAQDESWDSQALHSNEAWEMRITEEMTGGYFCRYHPAMEEQVDVKRRSLGRRTASRSEAVG
jgi:plastocyanin